MLRQTDHDPPEVLETPLSCDVASPLRLVRAVPVSLVLDRDPLVRVGEVHARDELAAAPDLVLDDRLGKPGVDDHQSGLRLLRRLHGVAHTKQSPPNLRDPGRSTPVLHAGCEFLPRHPGTSDLPKTGVVPRRRDHGIEHHDELIRSQLRSAAQDSGDGIDHGHPVHPPGLRTGQGETSPRDPVGARRIAAMAHGDVQRLVCAPPRRARQSPQADGRDPDESLAVAEARNVAAHGLQERRRRLERTDAGERTRQVCGIRPATAHPERRCLRKAEPVSQLVREVAAMTHPGSLPASLAAAPSSVRYAHRIGISRPRGLLCRARCRWREMENASSRHPSEAFSISRREGTGRDGGGGGAGGAGGDGDGYASGSPERMPRSQSRASTKTSSA